MAGQSIVCFIDVLGFASMVEEDASLGSPRHADKLRAVVARIRSTAGAAGFEVHQFSDSIVIATGYSTAAISGLIGLVSEMQYESVERHVLLRGGVALGHHSFEDGLLYSEALVAAYRIEVGKARYPRIIVDENVVALMRGTEPLRVTELECLVLRDRDGAIFIDYLGDRNLGVHETALRDLMGEANLNEVSIFEKYDWLVRYHNFSMSARGLADVDFGLANIRRL